MFASNVRPIHYAKYQNDMSRSFCARIWRKKKNNNPKNNNKVFMTKVMKDLNNVQDPYKYYVLGLW